MSHRHSALPCEEGPNAGRRYWSLGAEQLPVPTPSFWTLVVHLEPLLDVVSAIGAASLHNPGVLGVRGTCDRNVDSVPACLEFVDCYFCKVNILLHSDLGAWRLV